jgi:nucleoside-diphosphate-sugar epimerase
VVLGATGHLGSFAVRELIASGWRAAAVGRSGEAFERSGLPADGRIERVLSSAEAFSPELRGALARAGGIAVCLPVQMAEAAAPQVEEACLGRPGGGFPRVVAMSSARRRSAVADATVQEVVRAEAFWAASKLRPVLLRSTMIFGDGRDANLARLFAWAERHRWIPAPRFAGNVQPVFAPDLARAIRGALEAPPGLLEARLPADRALDIAGERPVELRELFRLCWLAATGRPPLLIPLPRAALRAGAACARLVPGAPRIGGAQIARLAEDKAADVSLARELLGFEPRPLEEALALKARWRSEALGGG